MYQSHNPNLLVNCKCGCFPPGLKTFYFVPLKSSLKTEKGFQETLHSVNKICCARTSLQSFPHRVLSTTPSKHSEAVISDEKIKREVLCDYFWDSTYWAVWAPGLCSWHFSGLGAGLASGLQTSSIQLCPYPKGKRGTVAFNKTGKRKEIAYGLWFSKLFSSLPVSYITVLGLLSLSVCLSLSLHVCVCEKEGLKWFLFLMPHIVSQYIHSLEQVFSTCGPWLDFRKSVTLWNYKHYRISALAVRPSGVCVCVCVCVFIPQYNLWLMYLENSRAERNRILGAWSVTEEDLSI